MMSLALQRERILKSMGGGILCLIFGIALPRFREQIEVFACGELLGADATSL